MVGLEQGRSSWAPGHGIPSRYNIIKNDDDDEEEEGATTTAMITDDDDFISRTSLFGNLH